MAVLPKTFILPNYTKVIFGSFLHQTLGRGGDFILIVQEQNKARLLKLDHTYFDLSLQASSVSILGNFN